MPWSQKNRPTAPPKPMPTSAHSHKTRFAVHRTIAVLPGLRSFWMILIVVTIILMGDGHDGSWWHLMAMIFTIVMVMMAVMVMMLGVMMMNDDWCDAENAADSDNDRHDGNYVSIDKHVSNPSSNLANIERETVFSSTLLKHCSRSSEFNQLQVAIKRNNHTNSRKSSTYLHIYICTSIHMYIYTYVYIYIHISKNYIHMYKYTNIQIYIYTCTHI